MPPQQAQVNYHQRNIRLLHETRRMVISERARGTQNLLRFQHHVERLLRQERRRLRELRVEMFMNHDRGEGNMEVASTTEEIDLGSARVERNDEDPPHYPILARPDGEPTTNSSTEGTVGSTQDGEHVGPSEEENEAFNRMRRQELMHQMNLHIKRYTQEREREFGKEHGYELYPPDD